MPADRKKQEITCEKCRKKIAGTIITALEKTWHIGCFLCTKCRRELGRQHFCLKKDGRPYCEKGCMELEGVDYSNTDCNEKKVVGTKRPAGLIDRNKDEIVCDKCRKEIQGTIIIALEKTWHIWCFRCNKCRRELRSQKFFLRRKDGKHYCEEDYKKLEGRDCSNDDCNEKVVWNTLYTNDDTPWHPECFKCYGCKKPIRDSFVFEDKKYYCEHDCQKKRSQEEKREDTKDKTEANQKSGCQKKIPQGRKREDTKDKTEANQKSESMDISFKKYRAQILQKSNFPMFATEL
ncbi:paxillin-like isoform X2 [Ptychodera flava]